MKTLSEILPETINQAKWNASTPQRAEPPKQEVMHSNQSEKQKLTAMLTQLFSTMKTYGKEPEQLEAIIPIFQLVLADYPFGRIEQAFAFYLKTNNEMPTPGDIANIIERGNKPPFKESVYIAITKKYAEDRTSEEWQYLKDYERFIVSGRG